MFSDLKILSPQADAAIRYTRANDWTYAASLTAIPVTRDEVDALAQEYAIVFSSTVPSFPMAVLGVDGKNAYLDASGQWAAKQLPARLAIYPFGTSVINGKTELVCDVAASHFGEAGGQPLFDENGHASPVMSEVTTATVRTHLGFAAIAAQTEQLEKAGLLADAKLDVKLPDGSAHALAGFQVIDAAAVAALDAANSAALEASGAMALLKLHQASMSQIHRALA